MELEIIDYFRECDEKLGFVPNVFRAYAFDNAKLKAFIMMAGELMLGDSGLSKTESEMIAVAVGAIYCLTSHGAALRQRQGPGTGRGDCAELSGGAAQDGLRRSRDLGYRRSRQLLQHVQPHG